MEKQNNLGDVEELVEGQRGGQWPSSLNTSASHHRTAPLAPLGTHSQGQRAECPSYLAVCKVPALIDGHRTLAQDQASATDFPET